MRGESEDSTDASPPLRVVNRLGRDSAVRGTFAFYLPGSSGLCSVKKMDYLTDPAIITPVLVVAVHFLTAAGFWYYFRQPPALESGNVALRNNSE